ncbi:MAG: valine--tRNA ligase, partial [Candidatus Marinimicrobia bacterium]|nr:valine--tRNA ligase [Candidatus Neomarinimicrobiota bacterium]
GPESATGQIAGHVGVIKTLARLDNVNLGNDLQKPAHSATTVVSKLELFVPLEGLIDLGLERARLEKRYTELEGHLTEVKNKLTNANFINRAPQQVVEKERQKIDDFAQELEKIKLNLDMLS